MEETDSIVAPPSDFLDVASVVVYGIALPVLFSVMIPEKVNDFAPLLLEPVVVR